jgi:ABC-2 type transport system ATP-binding protein
MKSDVWRIVVFLYDGKLLGFYEKDALIDGWKTIWVDRLPHEARLIKGIVAIQQEPSIRLISESTQETMDALASSGINIIKTQSLDLDEIFVHLLNRSKEETGGNKHAGFTDRKGN